MHRVTFNVQMLGLMDRLRERFSRQELRERAEHYLRGLLLQMDEKTVGNWLKRRKLIHHTDFSD